MPTFSEINDFVMKHTCADHFEADKKLYKKYFPNSKLIAELERAPEFAKKGLDERIVYELLNDGATCIDCIWENRGFARDKNGDISKIEKYDEETSKLIEEVSATAKQKLDDLSKAESPEAAKELFDSLLELIAPLPEKIFESFKLKAEEAYAEVMKPADNEDGASSSVDQSAVELLSATDVNSAKYNVLKKLIFDLKLDDKCDDHKADTYKTVLSEYKAGLNSANEQEETEETDKKKEVQE